PRPQRSSASSPGNRNTPAWTGSSPAPAPGSEPTRTATATMSRPVDAPRGSGYTPDVSTYVVVGAQWGDEAKGKIGDLLAQPADVVVRYGGGSNAGHTVAVGELQLKLHLVPSGILNPRCASLI